MRNLLTSKGKNYSTQNYKLRQALNTALRRTWTSRTFDFTQYDLEHIE